MLTSVAASSLVILTACALTNGQENSSNDVFVHYLCTLCTPYTSQVCCSMLNKCCFSECPEPSQLNCALGGDTCYYGRCPAGKKCCPGNLFFCCVDATTDGVDETTDGEDETTDGVDETTDGVDETTDGVDETTDGVDETTDGDDNNDGNGDGNENGNEDGDGDEQ